MIESIYSIDPEIITSTGMPGIVFKDPAVFESECHSIFVNGWVSIACGQQLKQPGDVLPVSIAGHSLIAVRGTDGDIAVFHNVCRHKGAPLVDGPCNKRVLVCPYHRWAYQLDGSLRGAPYYGGSSNIPISDMDKADKGLLKVRSAVWWDIVFVNISGHAEDFNSFIAPLDTALAEYDESNTRALSSTDYETACNWKLAVDNFLDGYHVPGMHRGGRHSAGGIVLVREYFRFEVAQWGQ
jgi:choline monooxygenase